MAGDNIDVWGDYDTEGERSDIKAPPEEGNYRLSVASYRRAVSTKGEAPYPMAFVKLDFQDPDQYGRTVDYMVGVPLKTADGKTAKMPANMSDAFFRLASACGVESDGSPIKVLDACVGMVIVGRMWKGRVQEVSALTARDRDKVMKVEF